MHHDLTSLRLFAAVVEQGNIAAAARAQNIAASAVSKRISDLEARLGVPLLYRLREGVAPTPAGQSLYAHIKRINHILENSDAEMSEFARGARGHVRLWANVSAVTQFLADDLVAYTAKHPEVRIELREDVSHRVVDAVANGTADVGIYSTHLGETGLSERVYRRDTLVVIVPRGHALEGRDVLRFAEVAAHPLVGLQHGSSLLAFMNEEAERAGLSLRMKVQVFGFDGIRCMVAAGLGIAIVPSGTALPYLSADGAPISAIKFDEPWAVRTLAIGCRDFASLAVPARELIESVAPLA